MIPICSWKSAAALIEATPMTPTRPATPSAATPTVCSPPAAWAPCVVAVPEKARSSASDLASVEVRAAFAAEDDQQLADDGH
jgi:hypothetical protein